MKISIHEIETTIEWTLFISFKNFLDYNFNQ